MPKKPSGEIGSTKISNTPHGKVAEILSVNLPKNKEDFEYFFASRFVSAGNQVGKFGGEISIISQGDTSDLDFQISGSDAVYLELAEIAPYSELVGRSALNAQWISVYDFSKWIYMDLIGKKQRRYGEFCKKIILMIYVARWEFVPSQTVLECLEWSLSAKGCRFHSVYVYQTNGSDLNIIDKVHPSERVLPHPRRYRDNRYCNFPPGRTEWNVPL